jgi:hypothetical protein
MVSFCNNEAAWELVEAIQDPVTRGLVKQAYEIAYFLDAKPSAEFDLLYFVQVMKLFLRDRQQLSRALLGDYGENITGLGE